MDGARLRPERVAEDDLVPFARAVNRHFYDSEEDDDVLPWVEALSTGYRAWWTRVDGRVAGNLGVIETTVSLPGGGDVPLAAITAVGVAQTMRRRGVMSGLMNACLDEAVARGEPLAGLFASEAAIYGRFGFGVAAPHVGYRVDRSRVRFRDPVDVHLVEEATPEKARSAWPELHDRVRVERPASVAKHPGQWLLGVERDIPGWRGGASARRLVEVPGRGYASYRLKEHFEGMLPAGSVRVLELLATDPEAEAALWQHVLDLDLTSTLEASFRPLDDTLPLLLADPHALRPTESPPLYLRLLDVPRILASRTYRGRGTVVLEVVDPAGHAQGRWRLEVDTDGATCTPDAGPATVVLPAQSLVGIVFGGVRATSLAAARRLEERRPGAAAELDHLMAVDRAPWTTMEF